MKMYLISDNVDTLMGMRLSGVEGVVLHEEELVRNKLKELMESEDIAIILMTKTAVDLCRDTVYQYKLDRKQPLIIEIPDRHGQGRTSDSITKYVNDAIGVKLT
ncbi:MAG: V-type ATP synthase subunit F [Ruminococcus sp.]|nr:V-type ATP synthase subunit F [Ruminococcus sp.]